MKSIVSSEFASKQLPKFNINSTSDYRPITNPYLVKKYLPLLTTFNYQWFSSYFGPGFRKFIKGEVTA